MNKCKLDQSAHEQSGIPLPQLCISIGFSLLMSYFKGGVTEFWKCFRKPSQACSQSADVFVTLQKLICNTTVLSKNIMAGRKHAYYI